jgi:hypothetical protein
MRESECIRRAISHARDADAAAHELFGALGLAEPCLVLLFVSPEHDLDRLARAVTRRFGDIPVVGCTTAGEIGAEGYEEGTIVGIALGAPDFAAAVQLVRDVRATTLVDMQAQMRLARLAISEVAPWARHDNLFAMTLIDGMSGCEEAVISAAFSALGGMPIRGGSAGDGMRFHSTHVLFEGQFVSGCALIVVIATRRAFRAFKTEHFVAGEEKTVVTAAHPERRIVTEINAEPAAEEYARITGFAPEALTPSIFATHPMVVRIGGQNFVRAIQRANEDGSLTFLCAIDEGVVLTVASSIDLMRDLEDTFDHIAADIGTPDLVIAFDCILRGLEMDQRQMRREASRLTARNNVVGFCTYGEQCGAMHVNQTFSGIAIGRQHA